ncbi:MAG: hypothetical protein WC836_16835, partial [Desulfobacula sp.]
CQHNIPAGRYPAAGDLFYRQQPERDERIPECGRAAFELINENPLPKLDHIMELAGYCWPPLDLNLLTIKTRFVFGWKATADYPCESTFI